MIHNQRLLASILYQTLHELNPDIPIINNNNNPIDENNSNSNDMSIGSMDIETGNTNTNINTNSNSNTIGTPGIKKVHQIGGDLDTTANNATGVGMTTIATNIENNSNNTAISTKNGISIMQTNGYKELTSMENLVTTSSKANAYIYNFSVLMSNMLQYSYYLMSNTVNDGGSNINSKISEQLLNISNNTNNGNIRNSYETLQQTSEYLYDMKHFGTYYHDHIKNWIIEILPELTIYFNKLTIHIIKSNKTLKKKSVINDFDSVVGDDESVV